MAEQDQTQDSKAALAEYMFNDEEIGPLMRDFIAKRFPKSKGSMPDVAVREVARTTVAEIQKEREDFRKERDEDRNRRVYEQAITEIKTDPDLHIRDEEIPEIEKLMKDEQIATHRGAARYYRTMQQVAAPRSTEPAGSPMSVPGVSGAGGDEFKDIVSNPERWGRNMAHTIITDFQNGRGQRWL